MESLGLPSNNLILSKNSTKLSIASSTSSGTSTSSSSNIIHTSPAQQHILDTNSIKESLLNDVIKNLPSNVKFELDQLELELVEGDITQKGYEKKRNKLLSAYVPKTIPANNEPSTPISTKYGKTIDFLNNKLLKIDVISNYLINRLKIIRMIVFK